MTTSWDDNPPDDCDAPESHPDGCACVRPGEEAEDRRERHAHLVERAVGSLLPTGVTFHVAHGRAHDVYQETIRWADEQVTRLIVGDAFGIVPDVEPGAAQGPIENADEFFKDPT